MIRRYDLRPRLALPDLQFGKSEIPGVLTRATSQNGSSPVQVGVADIYGSRLRSALTYSDCEIFSTRKDTDPFEETRNQFSWFSNRIERQSYPRSQGKIDILVSGLPNLDCIFRAAHDSRKRTTNSFIITEMSALPNRRHRALSNRCGRHNFIRFSPSSPRQQISLTLRTTSALTWIASRSQTIPHFYRKIIALVDLKYAKNLNERMRAGRLARFLHTKGLVRRRELFASGDDRRGSQSQSRKIVKWSRPGESLQAK